MKLTWYKFSRDYQQKSVDPNFFHEYILIKDFVSFKKALSMEGITWQWYCETQCPNWIILTDNLNQM